MTDDVLNRLLAGVHDARTRRLFVEVWGRIPAHDRATVAALVRGVIDDAPSALRLAEVGDLDASLRVIINLSGVPRVADDLAAAGVIAHELGHVVGQHGLAAPIRGLRVLVGSATSRADDDALESYLEDAAWFLAAFGWGFGRELHAFLDSYPRAQRPRWLKDDRK